MKYKLWLIILLISSCINSPEIQDKRIVCIEPYTINKITYCEQIRREKKPIVIINIEEL